MGARLLIVDDDDPTLELLSATMRMEGYDVETAATGMEALDVCGRVRPDLLILDVMLPGMTGLDVVRRLRQDPEIAATPVLLLSAWARDVDVWSGWMAGADAYVTKPMDLDDLLWEVSRLLASSASDRLVP